MTSEDVILTIEPSVPTFAINGTSQEEIMTSVPPASSRNRKTQRSRSNSWLPNLLSSPIPIESPVTGRNSRGRMFLRPMLRRLPAIEQDRIEDFTSIHKVPHRLREVKKIAYEPNVISVGPYHYGKEHLRPMEDVKRYCFSKIVDDTKLQFEDFKKYMGRLKFQAHKCYKGPIPPVLEDGNLEKFIEMMVYDGCFIVQLIRKSYPHDLCKLGRHIQLDMWYDLLLLENQLPFFVLEALDGFISEDGNRSYTKDFPTAAFSYFQQGPQIWFGGRTCPESILHLLDLVHKCCLPSLQGIEQYQNYKEVNKGKVSWKFIRSAIELDDTGIDFLGKNVLQDQDQWLQDHDQGQDQGLQDEDQDYQLGQDQGLQDQRRGLFDIIFTERPYSFKFRCIEFKIPMIFVSKKVLEIPTLLVDDNTERMLRNLLAHEQFTPMGEPTYVYDYVVLMDNLINTDRDVQLLCTSGVIDNWLGDDKAVAKLFNKLRDKTYSSEDFYYAEIFNKVNKHCKQRLNKYKAVLCKNYFSSPWSICAFVAASILLVVTVVQTAYACISYYHPK